MRHFLNAIAVWQVTSLAMFYVFGYLISHLVFAAYTEWIGDVQDSYGTYERLATYLGLLFLTAPATLASLMIFRFFG